MPDSSDFRDFKTIEEYSKTIEGNRYYHSLFLKAVNHPVRKEILRIINERKMISKVDLITILLKENIIKDQASFNYNMDYLIKALCVKIIKNKDSSEINYELAQSGEVINFL